MKFQQTRSKVSEKFTFQCCFLSLKVIALIAAILGKTGTRLDVTRMIPHFIRMVSRSHSLSNGSVQKTGAVIVVHCS